MPKHKTSWLGGLFNGGSLQRRIEELEAELKVRTDIMNLTSIVSEADRLADDFNDTVRGGQAAIRANVPGGIWARGLRARKRLERYFFDLLPERQRGSGSDLFSVLARSQTDDGLRFADRDVVNHMIFMLMAAHDTSTIALSMLTYELGRNPHWQNLLREESLAHPADTPDLAGLEGFPLLDQAFAKLKITLKLVNPFELAEPTLVPSKERSPYVLRLRSMWAGWRQDVIDVFPPAPGIKQQAAEYLAQAPKISRNADSG